MNNIATSSATVSSLSQRAVKLLHAWGRAAEAWWWPVSDDGQLGCFGTGYAHWGVQTHQKYVAAMAALAAAGGVEQAGVDTQWARDRALATLRYSLATHVSSDSDLRLSDGQRWGHTWISVLGIERMMYGVHWLKPAMTDADHEALRRTLTSEADWLLTDYTRGPEPGIQANVWGNSRKNDGESNIWNGALLWRAAAAYPDHPNAAAWRDRAVAFLVNGVSVASDAQSEAVVDGQRVRDLHVGANFFPNFAFDHHAYFNVGYMGICVSNAGILHFDLKREGHAAPEALHFHQADLWAVLRRMIFSDSRLARLGGDTRVRYCYCQEYLLPALLYAADQLDDPHALTLVERQITLMEAEADTNADGSFYGQRLAWLRECSQYYYLRLESDRANVLGMLLAYLPLLNQRENHVADTVSFEQSVAGGWIEPEYGSVMHRSPARLASFAWRAHGLAQAMCQPPDDGDLAEWSNNLVGGVWFEGGDGKMPGDVSHHRRLLRQHVEAFEGGFVTCGAIMEGVDLLIKDGWTGTDAAVHQIAFAALPDGHTVVGLQHCRVNEHRTSVTRIKGLHLNLPNDLLNGNVRKLWTEAGETVLTSPPAENQAVRLGQAWALVEGRVGVVGLYGGDELVVDRSRDRRGGDFHSLYVDQICWPHQTGATPAAAGEVVLDAGWAVVSGVEDPQALATIARQAATPAQDDASAVRGVIVPGQDGRRYLVAANFGETPVQTRLAGCSLDLPACRAVVVPVEADPA